MTLLTVRSIAAPRRIARLAAVALIAAAAPLAFAPAVSNAQVFGSNRPVSFADLAERLSPAVVNISTAQTVRRPSGPPRGAVPPGSPFEEFFREFMDPDNRRRGGPRSVQSLGSGFIIDPSGFVVTNNHVIAEADEIEVNFANGDALPARLIGRDPKTDIAVLKVDADEPLPFVPFGDSEAARVGDWVLAIGNPFGLGGSVSAGIISARNRDINSGPYDDFIQTDAAINRGNSGGPLFNMDGEVIGVNTAIISPSGGSIGIGFAVPSNIADNIVEQLRDFGRTRRGWLGVRIQQVDDPIAENLGLDRPRGALISNVDPEGPAAAAGLRARDVITRFDGQPIDEMRDLPRIVAETEVGATVDVEVFRNGRFEDLAVTVALLAEDDTTVASLDVIEEESGADVMRGVGIVVEAITDTARRRFNIRPETRGVVVTEVDPASSAAERGVRVGDVIVEVAQNVVETVGDVEREVERAIESDRSSVLLMINRDGELRFVAIDFNR